MISSHKSSETIKHNLSQELFLSYNATEKTIVNIGLAKMKFNHSVHRAINAPFKNTTLLFPAKSPLNLQTVQPIRHKDVAKTSVKRLIFGLKDVLDWSQMEVASRRLPGDVLKTSSRKRPQDHFQKTSLRRLRLHQDFFW